MRISGFAKLIIKLAEHKSLLIVFFMKSNK